MTSESRDDIKAIQRLSDGAIVTLGEHQKFYETKTQYEIWQSRTQMTTSAKKEIITAERYQDMKFNSLRMLVWHLPELQHISKALNRIGVYECNIGHSDKLDKKEEKLFKRASEIANLFDLGAYHQSDPRGCSLYLIKRGETQYTNGIAIKGRSL